MNSNEVVLDRTGLIQVAGGMLSLLVLGFVAGAVVGYGVYGGEGADGASASPVEAAKAALSASSTQACTPADPAGSLRMAEGILPTPRPTPPETRAGDDPAPEVATAVAAAAPEPTADAPIYAATAGKYAVQVGVFGVESNADRLAATLRRRGYDPLVTATRNRSGQWMKRVSLSVFTSEKSALAAAKSFTDREGLPAVVVAFREDEG